MNDRLEPRSKLELGFERVEIPGERERRYRHCVVGAVATANPGAVTTTAAVLAATQFDIPIALSAPFNYRYS